MRHATLYPLGEYKELDRFEVYLTVLVDDNIADGEELVVAAIELLKYCKVSTIHPWLVLHLGIVIDACRKVTTAQSPVGRNAHEAWVLVT